jgi:hypothetical protein
LKEKELPALNPDPNNVFPLISPLVPAYLVARGRRNLSSSFTVIL